MKIALISRYFLPYQIGGEEYHVHYLAQSLSRLGLEIHVFTSTDSEKRKRIEIQHVENRKDYTVHYVNSDLFGRLPLELNDFDVIHLHGFSRFAWPHLMKRYSCKKIVNTPHGALLAPYFEKSFRNLLKITFDNLVTKDLLRKLHRIIAITNFEKAFLTKKYGLNPQKIVVIPNAVPEEAFQTYRSEVIFPYKYLIGLGRISKIKRYDRIIKILPKIPKEIHFVLVGPDYGDLKNLLKLSRRLNVADRVHYLGAKYGREKYVLLRNAIALVISSSYESFPLVSIESLAQKSPVIAPNFPTLSEIILNEKTGMLYRPENLQELHMAVMQVIEKRQMLEKKIEEFQPRLREFSWINISKKVKEVYQND
ncbi:MAG: glycosyltransferase family 4 protein [Candidatus Jordarchaeaceae archaeon]